MNSHSEKCYIYRSCGLLLGRGKGGVLEVDRVGLELAEETVQPVVQGAAQTLRLESLPQADKAVRLQLCLEMLGMTKEALNGVPADLHLPVAVTYYWLRKARPDQMLLKALLMVMVQVELNRRKQSTGWVGESKHFPELLDCVTVQGFNQWQASLKDASQLNQLLCMPLPKSHFAWLYQGRLVHRRMKELLVREPQEIIQSAQFRRLYSSILEAVLQPDPGASAGGPEAHLNTG